MFNQIITNIQQTCACTSLCRTMYIFICILCTISYLINAVAIHIFFCSFIVCCFDVNAVCSAVLIMMLSCFVVKENKNILKGTIVLNCIIFYKYSCCPPPVHTYSAVVTGSGSVLWLFQHSENIRKINTQGQANIWLKPSVCWRQTWRLWRKSKIKVWPHAHLHWFKILEFFMYFLHKEFMFINQLKTILWGHLASWLRCV